MKPEETIDFHIRWAWHRISKKYNAMASEHQGSMSIGYALLSIDPELGIPSTKLGPKMGMESTSLSRTLKNMESKGLICRNTDNKDQRIVRILLTDVGKEKRNLAKQAVLKFNNVIRERIPENKLSFFLEIFGEINEVLAENWQTVVGLL